MRNLTISYVPFWLALLTEHEVLHCYVTNARSRPRCRKIVSVLRILFNRLSMVPAFQLLSGNSL